MQGGIGRMLKALKHERVGMASAITAGTALVVFFHAPLVPVVVGGLVALLYLAYRSGGKSNQGGQ